MVTNRKTFLGIGNPSKLYNRYRKSALIAHWARIALPKKD